MQNAVINAKTAANQSSGINATFLFFNRELLQSKLNGNYEKLLNSMDSSHNVPKSLASPLADAALIVAKNTYGRGVGISDSINQFSPYLTACQILLEGGNAEQAKIIFQNEVEPRYEAIRKAYTPHASHLEAFNSLRAHFLTIN